eukprot:TRINITY_DN8625_c0_g1_i2.p1 TRINITY_DN8625_c0_g1~~TRINITY_DN8625_c0_g1_i2.p1  ORF type:complete len:737 (+),score=219.95 TRINITY_DN8625_c0_g1_i2:159-2369(+)
MVLQLDPVDDVFALLTGASHIAAYSIKRGLVWSSAPDTPAEALEDHPEVAAIDGLVAVTIAELGRRGNGWLLYDEVEELSEWGGERFDRLRGQTTLPLLLGCFSLYDHDFLGGRFRLNPKHFAHECAATQIAACLERCERARTPAPAADPSAFPFGQPPQAHTYVSLTDVLREVRWAQLFEPYVGKFVDWVWNVPGFDLGVRRTCAPHAPCDVKIEDTDGSELAAVHAAAAVLAARHDLSMSLPALRHKIDWSAWHLKTSLDRFVAKHEDWFDVVPGRRDVGSTVTVKREKLALIPPDVPTRPPRTGESSETATDMDDPADAGDASIPRPHKLFKGLPYDEYCLKRAAELTAAAPTLPRPRFEPSERPGVDYEAIGAELRALQESLRAADEVQVKWREAAEAVRSEVTAALRGDFPDVRIDLFGTAANGLARKTSDIDMVVSLDGRGNASVDRRSVVEAATAVAAAGLLDDAVAVARARIPVVRGNKHGASVELAFATMCGVWNTRLVAAYLKEHVAVQPLVLYCAQWCRGWNVHGASKCFLSTYSITLMVIFWLQCTGHVRVLPLSDGVAPKEGEGDCGEPADCTDAELGRLLWGFFHFYAAGCGAHANVMSVRAGRLIPRTELGGHWRVWPFAVEDPYETHLNTCRHVDPRSWRNVRYAMEGTLRALCTGSSVAEAARVSTVSRTDTRKPPADPTTARRRQRRAAHRQAQRAQRAAADGPPPPPEPDAAPAADS